MLRLSSVGRFAVMAGVAAMVATACGGTNTPTSTDVGQGSLTGARATFPGPFYDKAFLDYSIKYPQVKVNYQAVGSGAGIQQFIKKTVDFGASDVPMGATDIASAGGESPPTQSPPTPRVVSGAVNVNGLAKLEAGPRHSGRGVPRQDRD